MFRTISSILFVIFVAGLIFSVADSHAAKDVIKWKYNSLWPSGFALYEADKYFV
jgi:hypothetical protein